MRKIGILFTLLLLGYMLPAQFTLAQLGCTPPLFFTTNPSDKSVDVEWFALPGATEYEIQWSDDGGQTWDDEIVTATPPPPYSATIDGLDPDTEYLMRIRTVCSPNELSEFTEEQEFRTLRDGETQPCPAVDFLDVQNVGSKTADLFWFPTLGASAYIVEYSKDGQTFESTPPTTDNFLQLTGLDPNTDYIIRVRSVCGDNVSDEFAEIEITTLEDGADSCPPPDDLTVSEVGETFAELAWERPRQGDADGLNYYQGFYAAIPNGQSEFIEFIPDTEVEISNLQPGTQYLYCMRSVCQKDFGEAFSDTVCVPFVTEGDSSQPVCPRPGRPEVFEVTDESGIVFWQRVNGAIAYIVEISTDGGRTWETAAETRGFQTEVEIEGLAPQTQYLVRVIAVCRNSGESEPSGETEFFTTPSGDQCPPPFDLIVTDIGSTSAFLDWEADFGQFTVGFEVEIFNQFTGESQFIFVEETELLVEDLRPGGLYFVSVRAVCDFGDGGEFFSEEAFTEFETTEGNPNCRTPGQIFAISTSESTANLLWEDIDNADRYFVEYRAEGETDWTSVNVQDTSFVRLTELEPNTFYEVRVRAVCGAGEISDFSPIGEFETLQEGATECPKPEITEIDPDGFSAEFEWSVPEPNNVQFFQYWVTTDLDDFGDGKVTERPEGDWEDLAPNTTYFLIVRAICQTPDGEQYPSDLTIQEFQTEDAEIECDAPEIIDIVGQLPEFATLIWSGSDQARFYQIRARVKGTDEWFEFDWEDTEVTELTFQQLEIGVEYEFQVCAVCVPNAEEGIACSDIEDFVLEEDNSPCPAPANLRINRILDDRANLRWEYFTDNLIEGFEVKVFDQEGNEVINRIAENTRLNLRELEPCTDYFVEITALCPDENGNAPLRSEPLFGEFRTEGDCPSDCPAPLEAEAVEVGEEFVFIEWEALPSAGFSWEVVINDMEFAVQQPFFEMGDLEPCREYAATIRTICGADGEVSEPVTVTFATECPEKCPPPRGIEIGEITPNSAFAFWGEVEGAQAYQITVEPRNGDPAFSFFALTPPAELENLVGDTEYVVSVQTICEDSLLSEPVETEFKTPAEELDCPEVTFLADSSFGGGAVAFFWSVEEVPQIVGFQYRLFSGNSVINEGFTENFEQFYENLEPGTYTFVVRTVCISGNGEERLSDPREVTVVIVEQCERPQRPEITEVSENGATVSWNQQQNARFYEVRYRRAGASEQWEVRESQGTAIDLPELEPGAAYVVCVRAICAEGLSSDWSECREFATGELTCDSPDMPEAFDINYNSATISWNDVPGAAEYKLEISADNGATWTAVTVAENEYRVENLTQETLYLVRVSTICENGLTSDPSNSNEFVTPAKPPLDCPAPQNVRVSEVTRESAFVEWDAPNSPNITGYRYMYVSGGFTSPMRFTPRTEAELIELTEGTDYEIIIQSVCVDEETNQEYFSGEVTDTFRTIGDPPACPAPGRPGVRDITQESAVVFWDAVPGAIGYEVEYSFDGGQTWSSLTTEQTGVPLNGLTPDTGYLVRVKTICEGERVSGPSQPRDFRTPPVETECPAPTGLRVGDFQSASATAFWNDVPGAVRYEVYYTLTPGVFIPINAADNQAQLFGLQPGREYQAYVVTICEGGVKSAPSETITFTLPEEGDCVAPTGVQVVNVGNSSARVEWNAVPTAQIYRVAYRVRGQGQFNTVSVSNRTSLDLTSLNSGTEYEVKVLSICSGGRESEYSDEEVFTTTDLENCDPPAEVIVSDVTESRAEISWPAVPGAQGYELTYRKDGTNQTVTLSVTQSTSRSLTGLESGATYIVTVRTLCTGEEGTGFSDPSTPVNFTTRENEACPQPIIVSIEDITQSTAIIAWQGSPQALGYQISLSADSGATYTDFLSINTAYEFENLTPGVNYFVKVRALCPGGAISPDSPVEDFRTLKEGGCTPPENIVITTLTHELVSVSWDPVPNVFNYEVRLILKATNDTVNVASVGRTNAQFAGLIPDAEYEITVRALCPNGELSDFGVIGFRTETIPPCVAPEEVVVDEILATSAVASWSSVRGARGYQVNLSFDGGVSFITIFPFLQDTTVDLNNLVADSTYVLQVLTICFEGGLSVPSDNADFTTLPEDDCVSPKNVIVNTVGQDTAAISWDASGGATFYEVQYRLQSMSSYTTLPLTTQTDVVLRQLIPGGAYAVRIRAICEINNETSLSVFSPDVPFQTQSTTAPCNAPGSFEIDNITENSATITWLPVNGAVAYEVSYSNNQGATYVTLPLTTTTTVDLTNLLSDVNYRVRIRSVCGANTFSDYARKNFDTDPSNTCSTPTGLTVNFINANDATVSWNPVPGAIDYQVSYKTVLGNFFITINETNTSRRLIGLDAGTEYIVKVRARCASGANPFTPWTTNFVFQTQSSPSSCPAPRNFNVTADNPTTATASWFSTPGAFRYRVSYSFDGGSTFINLPWTTDTFQIMSGLTPGDSYLIRVRAQCTAVSSENTGAVQITMPTNRAGMSEGFVSDFTVYPNPTSGFAQVKFSATQDGEVSVRVIDMTGRAVRSQTVDAQTGLNEVPLQLEELSGGVYQLQIISEGRSLHTKLIVQ